MVNSTKDGDLRFGLASPEDWLAKARRELRRLEGAEGADKVDHAINAAITLAQVVDWSFNAAVQAGLVDQGERRHFLDTARKKSTDTAILTDISNTSKHYKLDRKPVSSALSVSEGRVLIPREFLYSEFKWPEQETFRGRIKSVRTIIDDDEIVGFEYVVGEHGVLTKEGYLSFEITCDEALAFWDDAIKDIRRGKRPGWLD